MSSNWLAGPGQWWVLFVSWGSIAIFYLTLSWKLGKAVGSEFDGCLLMFCNLLFVILGGMVGLILFHFPYNLISSMFLSLIAPSAVTLTWHKRINPHKRP